jgi:Zn-dependent M28 family amino/carboxypeptidase
LLGSRYYARNPLYPLARTIAAINLEHMGRTDETSGPRVGVLNATGFDYSTVPSEVQKAGEDFGIQVTKDEKNSDAFFPRSDNQAFADAGIPSHTFSVGYMFPEYHRPGDEWPKIDYENMAKVVRTVALGIYRIADSAEAPVWNAGNPRTERYVKAHKALSGAGQ